MSESKKAGEENFDMVMKNIEILVEKLEKGDLALEESLQAFEQGMKLIKNAESILEKAEKRVEILLSGGDDPNEGPARTRPFETNKQIVDT